MIGKTISQYTILEELGRGGMGVVYKAEDTKLMRTVALKFLPPHLTQDDEAKTRFITEAQAASALDHQNICTIFDIKEAEDEQLYIVMAYYEGQTLRERVARGELRVEEAVDVASLIAAGLARAHEAGITHRDIKPSNIMITERGEVKILDFGIARIAGQKAITKTDATLGTVAYMSPEQVKGEKVDHRTDLWSLGVVLYEMLAGQRPFDAEYDQAVMYSIVNQPHEPISALREDVPEYIEQIVDKALAKNADERYRHADAMLDDLNRKPEATGIKKTISKPATIRKGTPAFLWPALILSAIVLAIAGYFFFGTESETTERIPIAVVSFENMTGDTTYNYLQKAIPNLLITSLEQSPNLQVTTWERLRDLLKQTGKEYTEIIDKDLGYELCRMDGVNTIVVGSFVKAGNAFTTEVKIIDVSSKRLLKGATANGLGEESILINQVDEVSREISKGVGLSETRIKITQRPIAGATTHSMEAYNYYLLGRDSYEKRNWAEAIKFLGKAVALDSTFAIAHAYLCEPTGSLGHVDKWREAKRLAKKFAYKATAKEQFIIKIKARLFNSNEELKQIVEAYAREYPKEKRAHYELGVMLRFRGQLQEAVAEHKKVLALDPDFGLSYNQMGYIYHKLGSLEKSIQYLEKYASVAPGTPNPYDSMGDIYYYEGMLDDAIKNYKKAVSIQPDFNAHFRVGYCYALKEDYENAILWQTRFINEVQPGSYQYAMRALYHQWAGANRQALRDLGKSFQLADSVQNQFSFYFFEALKAWLYYDQGAFQPGRAALKRWFGFAKNNIPKGAITGEAHLAAYFGFVDIREGKLDSAKHQLNKLRTLLPELEGVPSYAQRRVNNYYKLLYAETLLAEDSLAKAISVYQQLAPRKRPGRSTASRIAYNEPLLEDVLARTYLKTGDFDQAIAEYERLTTFDPKSNFRGMIHPKYHYRLAKLYEQAGQPEKAIARYEKLLKIWQNADEDLPELIDAKTRYARLRGE